MILSHSYRWDMIIMINYTILYLFFFYLDVLYEYVKNDTVSPPPSHQKRLPNGGTKNRVSMAIQRMWRFGMGIESNRSTFTGKKQWKLYSNSEENKHFFRFSKDISILVMTLGNYPIQCSPWITIYLDPPRTLKNGRIKCNIPILSWDL